jgi:hypothetical protein
MSRDASLGPLDWADGSYTFKLDWERLILLQEATDAGPLFLLDRLGGKHVRLQDISHTIRLGLIGGGTKPEDALKLVRAYVESRPMIENTQIAYAILAAGVMGAPDEAPGEPAGAAATGESSTTSPTENTASP